MNTNIVKYIPPNLSGVVCSEKYALEVPEVSVIDLSRLLTIRLDVCICNGLLADCFKKLNPKPRDQFRFDKSLWNYVIINEEVHDVFFRNKFLKDEDFFSDLTPLVCRIMGQILLKKSISSYPTWLLYNGKHNIFYIRCNGVNTTLIAYENSRQVWVLSLYGTYPKKHQIGDKVFGPVIHDFV